MSASPERLVIMLYDGARRYLHHAAVAMRDGRMDDAHIKLRRAEDIIAHLRGVLDLDQGEIALRLQSIYLFCQRHLLQARFDRDPAKIEQVGELLGRLRETWATVEARESARGGPAATHAAAVG